MTAYRLAIDYGTSYSGAAIADLPDAAARGRAAEARTVFVNGRPTIASVVVLEPRDGELLTGEAAENASGIRPELVVRTPKRYLGQHEPLFREPRRIEPEDAVAATLRALAAEAAALRDRQPPAEVRLTHPARWAEPRRAALRDAAGRAGLGEVSLLPEPVAAALRFAAGETIEPGQFVAVYDLGAGTFDTAVLERTADGFALRGVPGGLELGGDSLDERLYQHLGRQLEPADWDAIQNGTERVWRNAQADFRRWIRLAKEALSGNPRGVDVRYPGPTDHEPLWLTRDELNEQLRADLVRTVDELDRTIGAADLTPDRLAAVYLAGGSSKIPLVETLIVQRFGLSARLEDDRKQVVALGAAGASDAAVGHQPVVAAPPPPPPVVDAPPPVVDAAPPPTSQPTQPPFIPPYSPPPASASFSGPPPDAPPPAGPSGPPAIPPPVQPTAPPAIPPPVQPTPPPVVTPPGAGGGGPAWTPPPPQPGPGGRNRLPIVAGGIAAAVVAAVVLAQVMGGSTPTSRPSSLPPVSVVTEPPTEPPTRPPTEPPTDPPVVPSAIPSVAGSAADAYLIDLISARNLDVDCRVVEMNPDVDPADVIAVVDCDGGTGFDFLYYYLFDSDSSIEQEVQAAKDSGLGDGTDVCGEGGGWRYGTDSTDVTRGDLLCSRTTHQDVPTAWIEWTEFGNQTYGHVYKENGDLAALWEIWKVNPFAEAP